MKSLLRFALALVILLPTRAQSGAPATTDDLRKEIQQLRQDYEQRIRQLEDRLKQMEARTPAPGAPAPTPTNLATAMPAPAAAPGGTNRTAEAGREFARQAFARNTEDREAALAQETDHPMRDRVEQVLRDFVDISGYFRAGYGVDDEGGTQVAFRAPGAMSKYRLGNETENYGELVFGKNWYSPGVFSLDPAERAEGGSAGPIARTQVRMAFNDDYATHDFRTSLPEAWVSIGNVIGANPSTKFWAGNRFYRRHDIHVTDFYFYNMSGYGGGIEDFAAGPGKLALAWIGNSAESSVISDVILPDPANQAGFTKRSIDLRYYDVNLPLGKGEFGLAYAYGESGKDQLGNKAPDTDGVALNFIHTRERFLDESGFNKFSLQAGTGLAKNFNSGYDLVQANGNYYILPDARDSWRFRVTEHFATYVAPGLSLGPVLVYQYTDYKGPQGRQHWLSAGVRPVLEFSRHISLAFEGGVDYVDDSGARTRDYLYKLTLAPQVSLGRGFMSRPVLRAFATYAHWGPDFVGKVGGNDYLTRDDGWTWGVQMETWW